MNTRNAIAELLRAGHSDRAVARQVHVRTGRIAEIRSQLGLPVSPPGPRRDTNPEDHFWRHAVPTDDGHLLWPYRETAFRTGHEGRKQSVRRVAFRIGNHREPVGHVRTGCTRDGCVHPRCVEDQQMRDQYRAIFQGAAA